MDPKSFLILGLPADASLKMAKKAYRELVKEWHPDRFQNDPLKRQEAEEKIKQINLAFEQIQEYREKHPFTPKPNPKPRTKPRTKNSPKPKTGPLRPDATLSKQQPPPPPNPNRNPNPTPPSPLPPPSRPPNPVSHQTVASPFLRRRSVFAAAASVTLVGIITLAIMLRKEPEEERAPASQERLMSVSELEQARLEGKFRVMPPAVSAGPAPSAVSAEVPLGDVGAIPNLSPAISRPAAVELPKKSLDVPAAADGSLSPIAKQLFEKARVEDAELASARQPALDAESNFRSGLRHAQGEGVLQDFAEAARLYRLAAEAGHVEAQKHLGFLYATGKGVTKDPAEAERWLRKAGGQGNVGADFASALLALSKTNGAAPVTAKGKPAQTGSPAVRESEGNRSAATPAVMPKRESHSPSNSPPAVPPPQLKRRSELLQTNAPAP